MVNVPTSFSNLKTKVDDLDVGTLKTVPIDLKNLSDVVDDQVVKNTLKAKVKNLEKNIPDATTVIHINQNKWAKFGEKNMEIKNTTR